VGSKLGDFRGREKAAKWWSDTGRGVTEGAEVAQDLVKTRSSWFPALLLEGDGVSIRPNVAKQCLIGRVTDTAWSSSADLVRCSRVRTWYDHFGEMWSPIPPPRPEVSEKGYWYRY